MATYTIERIQQTATDSCQDLTTITEAFHRILAGTLSTNIFQADNLRKALGRLETAANKKDLCFVTPALPHLFELPTSCVIDPESHAVDIITHIPVVEDDTMYQIYDRIQLPFVFSDMEDQPRIKYWTIPQTQTSIIA